MNRIAIYIHVYTANRWEAILSEIISAIVHSGLYENTDKITLCVTGKWEQVKFDLLKASYGKLNFVHTSEENHYEWDTLQTLWAERDTYDYVLYLHTKGASGKEANYEDCLGKQRWCNYMLWWNVRHWQSMVNVMKQGYQTAGALFMNIRNGFWVGNFWWARADYIKTLTEPHKYNRLTKIKNKSIFNPHFMRRQPREHIEANRWGCEMWVTDKVHKKKFEINAQDPQNFAGWENSN